ncbi:MAG TPA: adenylate/guanylate cyclase domain-containing protein, partial [Acidimicrobiia bacterium]|nr:adenylate/guanylate cyclase domain-containing protein [Acidimicrobiia bacterium]
MPATVTVSTLFTDLVDSTAVASRLGPEATEALRREHYALLRAATAASGGTEVKSTGDGLMVVFPSPSAAVDCAVAMQQALERFNRDAPEPLRVRIGVSIGEAEQAEDDYYGQSVVEAARLCAAADGGQILAADVVRALGGGRGGHAFRPVGALELKGLSEPVSTCEVVWAPVTAPALPFPSRLRGWDGGGFFGRRDEAELLAQAVKDAGGGTRRAVLIAGEAGIGKTRLMAEAARVAHDAGATVLYGRCDEDLGVPYQPFAEALGDFVEAGPASVVDAHLERRGGALARLVPELARRAAVPPLESVNADAELYLLFGAVVDLLERAAAESPVLLILDDLHWADTPSLRLLRHLLASSDDARLLVLAAYRE